VIYLRAVLAPSLLAQFTDAGGIFWSRQVEGWTEAIAAGSQGTGSAYQPIDAPRFASFPATAAVYFRAPDSVTPDKLGGIAEQWSKRTNWVNVARLTIVDGVPTVEADREALAKGTLPGLISAVAGGAGDVIRSGAKLVSNLLTIVAIGGAVALVLFVANKSGGTKQWD
jgi:hypothetical protein